MPRPRRRKPVTKTAPNAEIEETRDTLLDRVEGDLSEDGIKPFDNEEVDNDYLVLPRYIDDVDSRELGRYLNTFTQQKMWTRTLLGRVNVELRECDQQVREVQYQVYSELPAKMTVKEKDVYVRKDERAEDIMKRYDYLAERQSFLVSYLESLTEGIFNISRAMTNRASDIKSQQREDNANNQRR